MSEINLHEAMEKLAKEYDLSKTDTAFLEWYAGLSKSEREALFPIIMTTLLDAVAEILGKRK